MTEWIGRLPTRDGDPLVGKVRLLREIGRGGMGVVYAGWHTVLDVPVAVKLLLNALRERSRPRAVPPRGPNLCRDRRAKPCSRLRLRHQRRRAIPRDGVRRRAELGRDRDSRWPATRSGSAEPPSRYGARAPVAAPRSRRSPRHQAVQSVAPRRRRAHQADGSRHRKGARHRRPGRNEGNRRYAVVHESGAVPGFEQGRPGVGPLLARRPPSTCSPGSGPSTARRPTKRSAASASNRCRKTCSLEKA